MADIKISQLGAAIAVGDTDLLPIVSGGNTLKATAAQVKEHSIGDTNISGIGDGSVTGAIIELNTDKQPKTLDTPLTIGGVSKTTVEDALGGLVSENQTLTTSVNVLGAKNLLPNYAQEQVLDSEITVTLEDDGTIVINGTATSNKVLFINSNHTWLDTNVWWAKEIGGAACKLLSGDYENHADDPAWSITLQFDDASGNHLATAVSTRGIPISITIPSSGINKYAAYIIIVPGTYNNVKIKPLLKLKDLDNAYEPYVLTNRQLTPKVIAENKTNASMGQYWEAIQIGNVVIVSFSAFNVTLANYPDGIIANGLPKPITGGFVYGLALGIGTEYRISVSADGTLQIKDRAAGTVTSNPGYITGQLTYLT